MRFKQTGNRHTAFGFDQLPVGLIESFLQMSNDSALHTNVQERTSIADSGASDEKI